jgi:hypothetical protein
LKSLSNTLFSDRDDEINYILKGLFCLLSHQLDQQKTCFKARLFLELGKLLGDSLGRESSHRTRLSVSTKTYDEETSGNNLYGA